jgi:DNA repair protein SbcC/Rad50
LENYRYDKFRIPGVDRSIDQFIDLLNNEMHENENLIIRLQNLERCINSLKKIRDNVQKAIQINDELKITSGDEAIFDPNKPSASDIEKERIESEYEIVKKNCEEGKNRLIKNNVNPNHVEDLYRMMRRTDEIKPYESYDDLQLPGKIEALKNEVVTLDKQIEKDEKIISDLEAEIKRLDSMAIHPLRPNLEYLEEAQTSSLELARKFQRTFDDYISDLIDLKKPKSQFSADENRYSEFIGKYLAAKLGEIKHIDKVYKVKSVNVVEETIITSEGIEIQFGDFGTGQSQSTYLQALLNLNDNKKIVALFDEVAMMDDESLKPIKDKLRELYQKKKLLLGIIVQKSNKLEIEKLI